jgi:hypothetical protein
LVKAGEAGAFLHQLGGFFKDVKTVRSGIAEMLVPVRATGQVSSWFGRTP